VVGCPFGSGGRLNAKDAKSAENAKRTGRKKRPDERRKWDSGSGAGERVQGPPLFSGRAAWRQRADFEFEFEFEFEFDRRYR
jgi:hypothetical protein